MTTRGLLTSFRKMVEREDEIRASIAKYLPTVIASSKRNAEIARDLLEDARPRRSLTDRLMLKVERSVALPDQETLQRYLGTIEQGYLGHAADPAVRARAASGGAVSAILIDLLEHGIIDGALVSRLIVREGVIGAESLVARNRTEILSAQSSIYMGFSMNQTWQLLEREPGRLAVVALPCHIRQLRRREARNLALAEKITARIALVCGRNSSKALLDRVMKKKGVEESQVADMRFRQGHWRGKMHFDLATGERVEFPFQHFGLYRNLHFFCEEKCLYCEDPLGEWADIVFGDAWLWDLKDQPVKHSLILARTEQAADWIDQMIKREQLIAELIQPETVFRAQRRVLIPAKRGKAAKARLSGLFGLKMRYSGSWKARWNDYLAAGTILLNHRWSHGHVGGLIFRLPRPLLQAYLIGLSLLKNF